MGSGFVALAWRDASSRVLGRVPVQAGFELGGTWDIDWGALFAAFAAANLLASAAAAAAAWMRWKSVDVSLTSSAAGRGGEGGVAGAFPVREVLGILLEAWIRLGFPAKFETIDGALGAPLFDDAFVTCCCC